MSSYYFGCYKETGHFWFKERQRVKACEVPLFHGFHPDGTFAPLRSGKWRFAEECPEGIAQLVHASGAGESWTILAFWDRSVDQRGKSNSLFLIPGNLTFTEAIKVAREEWPEIFARFKFEVLQYKPEEW
jgi:hypothetical protein